MVEVLGWTPQELVGKPSTEYIHPEDRGSGVTAWMEMLSAPGDTNVWRGRYQGADGTWKWVETVNVNHLNDAEHPVVDSTMTLVAGEQASVEEELRAREQLIARLSDALPVGLFQIDAERRLTFTNDRFHTIVGSPRAATIGAQFPTVSSSDRVRLNEMLTAVLGGHAVDEIDIHLGLPATGPDSPMTAQKVGVLAVRPLTDGAGRVTGAIGCLTDITERVQLQHELEIRASVDKLTACLNRGAVMVLLEASLAQHGGTAIMFVDLDHFKQVNDQYGHAAGDLVLQAAARLLAATVRTGDQVARIGGDEFLVICPEVRSADAALSLGHALAEAVTIDISVGEHTVALRASIGVAWTDQQLDVDAFIAQADAAMYQSKRARTSTAALWKTRDGMVTDAC